MFKTNTTYCFKSDGAKLSFKQKQSANADILDYMEDNGLTCWKAGRNVASYKYVDLITFPENEELKGRDWFCFDYDEFEYFEEVYEETEFSEGEEHGHNLWTQPEAEKPMHLEIVSGKIKCEVDDEASRLFVINALQKMRFDK